MGGHRCRTKALRRMMATGKISHTTLPCVVGLRLRNLTRKKGVGAGSDGRFKIRLRAARAPGDATNRPQAVSNQQGRSPQYRFDMGPKSSGILKFTAINANTEESKFLLAKAMRRLQSQAQPELGVVTKLGMSVQRKMVGKQVDVMSEQQGQAPLHPSGNPPVLATPEKSMMHKDGIGMSRDGRLDQPL